MSPAVRLLTLVAVLAAGSVSAPASAAPGAPAGVAVATVRTYPLQRQSVPEELRARARARLPNVARRVVELIGDEMDQDVLLPVQVVSALHIRNAFRRSLGRPAWHSALRIAWRESRLLPNVVNDQNKNKTEDWGLFQLNDGGTLQYVGGVPGSKALRPRWNARAAARLVATHGWNPWGGML